MKHIRILALCALLCLGLLAFSGCGSKPASSSEPAFTGDYKQLETLLDRGQYDAAISWIETLRENADRVIEPIDMDEEARKILPQLVGEYSRRPDYVANEEYSEAITVRDDMTFTEHGKTYSFEIVEVQPYPQENYTSVQISYSYPNENGDTSIRGRSFVVYDSGYVTFSGSHQKNDFVEKLIAEQFPAMVGTFKCPNADDVITLREDRTMDVNGTVRQLYFAPDGSDHSVLALYAINSDGYLSRVGLYHDEQGLLRISGSFYRLSDLELISLTADNLMDYFEWIDWEVNDKDENAFGDLTSVRIIRRLKLKDPYTSSVFRNETTFALEISFQEVRYSTASFTWDPKTDAVAVTIPETPDYTYDPSTTILNSLGARYVETRDGSVLDYYYLTGSEMTGRVSDSTLIDEDGIYHFEVSGYYDNFDANGMTITRSASTLALIK